MRLALTTDDGWSLSVVGAGLACCTLELLAASLAEAPDGPRLDLLPDGAAPPSGPSALVVSGTVTEAVAPALVALHASLTDPVVVSFGSCANTGGPYWDSYAVVSGVHELFPVDVTVPGCPPRPEALLDGLLLLQRA